MGCFVWGAGLHLWTKLYLSSFLIPATLIYGAATLEMAYLHALESHESLSMARSKWVQTEERLAQGSGSFLPKISLGATHSLQDSSGTNQAAGASGLTRRDQTNAKLTALQPLFRGLGDFAALRGLRAEHLAAEKTVARARQTLYQAVAESFFDVLAAEQDLVNLQSILKLTEERVKDLSQRVRIGRSRKGDALSSQAQFAVVQAELQSAENLVKTTRDRFSLATSLPPETELQFDFPKDSPDLAPLESFLEKAKQRPDLEALASLAEMADEQIVVARAGHFPTVDLTGNYYLKRTGSLEGVDWDLGLSLKLPLFEGGSIQAAVREAAAKYKEKTLELNLARREAETQVRAAYHNVQNDLTRLKLLGEAQSIAEMSYQEQNRDYKFGLVNNLEVLQALNTLQETKRNLDQAKFETLKNWASLKTATGEIPY